MRPPAWVVALVIVLAVSCAPPGAAAAPSVFHPGAAGLGDPIFPRAGNGGYEVDHYDLDLSYRPRGNRLVAQARISATATKNLSAFDLDYRGPPIRSVKVNGAPARHRRHAQELVITPKAGLRTGRPFAVVVRYAGRPRFIRDADGLKDGWVPTDDGAFVAGQPQGSTTWFPCNDHPSDKATYSFRIAVPRGLAAIANGRLVSRRDRGRSTIWTWRERQPMITYLATASTGRFELSRAKLAGIRSVVAIDPREARESRRPLRPMSRIISFFSSLFGPYPFDDAGVVVDHLRHGPTALETQTRPTFPQAPSRTTVAHELAHQWFGDSVSIADNSEIWLNEGFATWAEWRWRQERGGETLGHVFRRFMSVPAHRSGFWNPPPAAVDRPKRLFSTAIYVRGAMTLEALRRRVGNRAFYATLRGWARHNAGANGTTAEFIALAEARSHRNLRGFFHTWLYRRGKP